MLTDVQTLQDFPAPTLLYTAMVTLLSDRGGGGVFGFRTVINQNGT